MKFNVSSNDCYAKKKKKKKKRKRKRKKFENPLEVELVAVLHCQNFGHEEQKKAYILEGYLGIVALVYE